MTKENAVSEASRKAKLAEKRNEKRLARRGKLWSGGKSGENGGNSEGNIGQEEKRAHSGEENRRKREENRGKNEEITHNGPNARYLFPLVSVSPLSVFLIS